MKYRLIWEVVAYWIYCFLVWPGLFLCVFTGMMMFHISEIAELCQRCRRDLRRGAQQTAPKEVHGVVSGEEQPEKFCQYHYKDPQLIADLTANKDDDELKLFEREPHECWALLHDAKQHVDTCILLERIEQHILSLSSETQFTNHKFLEDIIKKDYLKANGGETVWTDYFQPLAESIFSQIQSKANLDIPLHLFAKFPFEVVDDFQQWWTQHHRGGLIQDCSKQDIVSLLTATQLLGCKNRRERRNIVDRIEESKLYADSGREDTIFFRFMKYLYGVKALFQDHRTLKNMIRDTNRAIAKRGIDTKVRFPSHQHQDIDTMGIACFSPRYRRSRYNFYSRTYTTHSRRSLSAT